MAQISDVSTALNMLREVGMTHPIVFEPGLLQAQEAITGNIFEFRGDFSVDGGNKPVGNITSITALGPAGNVLYRVTDFSIGFAEALRLSDSGDRFAVDQAILSGNDTLRGTLESDSIRGYGQSEGGGDLYIVSGTRCDYRASESAGVVTLRDTLRSNNIDELRDVEFVQFDDGIVSIPDLVAPPPALSVGDIAVNEGEASAVFTLTLAGPASCPITMRATTADGTALAGTDYAGAASETVTFAPGETVKTVAVPILPDEIEEPDETFTLTLTADKPDLIAPESKLQATGTIVDDEPPIVLVNDVTVAEGAGTATFAVGLSMASEQPITFTLTTLPVGAAVTATPGADFGDISGQTLTIQPGETAATAVVPIVVDTIYEANEAFTVNLAPVSSELVAPASRLQATGTITDDDPPPRVIVAAPAPLFIPEDTTGPVRFNVFLSGPSEQAISFGITVAGTALGPDVPPASPADIAVEQNLIFEPNTTFLPIEVSINDNTTFQSQFRGFTLTLNPIAADLVEADSVFEASAVIVENDPEPEPEPEPVFIVPPSPGIQEVAGLEMIPSVSADWWLQ